MRISILEYDGTDFTTEVFSRQADAIKIIGGVLHFAGFMVELPTCVNGYVIRVTDTQTKETNVYFGQVEIT